MYAPTPAGLIQQHLDSFAQDLHTALPGKVVSYDPETQTADVEPLLRRSLFSGDGDRTAEDLPILPAVPVVWPRGGGYYVHMPLGAGDTVLLVFTEMAHAAALEQDGVADAGDEGRHTLAGAVAIPMLASVVKRLASADAPAGAMRVGKEGATQIEITSSGIKLGGADAVDFVALATKVNACFAAMVSVLTPIIPAGTETGFATFKAALTAPGFFPSVASTVVGSK